MFVRVKEVGALVWGRETKPCDDAVVFAAAAATTDYIAYSTKI